MYSVAKRIEFCYGHRLLDYNGVCAHPHGHNAVAELEIRSESLDARNMVMDFSDIKRAIKTWVDRELDHKMILRRDDPLVPVLQGMGEPVFVVDSNPTAERIARLIFDVAREQGLPVSRVTVWETPTSWATYGARSCACHPGALIAFDLDGTLVDSRQDLADSANQLVVERGGQPLSQEAVVGMVGEGAAVLVRRALDCGAAARHPRRVEPLPGDLRRAAPATRRECIRACARWWRRRARAARVAVLTNKPLRHTERLLEGLGVRHLFDHVIGGDGPHPRKPSPDGLRALMAGAGATAQPR